MRRAIIERLICVPSFNRLDVSGPVRLETCPSAIIHSFSSSLSVLSLFPFASFLPRVCGCGSKSRERTKPVKECFNVSSDPPESASLSPFFFLPLSPFLCPKPIWCLAGIVAIFFIVLLFKSHGNPYKHRVREWRSCWRIRDVFGGSDVLQINFRNCTHI